MGGLGANSEGRGVPWSWRPRAEMIIYPRFYSIWWLTWWVSSLRKPRICHQMAWGRQKQNGYLSSLVSDDPIFFLKLEVDSIRSISKILHLFCSMSGIHLNWDKSSLLGINMEQQRVKMLADSIGCKHENWPIKYLGIPLWDNPLKISFREPVISRFSKKLAGWKKSFLSKGGRLTLIQSVLDSIPIYYISLFRIPKGVANFLDTRFPLGRIWGGFQKSPRVLGHCYKIQGERGLGIGNLTLRNKALLGKWWWRFAKERSTLWGRVIESKYGIQEMGGRFCNQSHF